MTLHLQRVDTYFSVYTSSDDPTTPLYVINTLPSSYWNLDAVTRLRSALELYDLDDLREALRPLIAFRRNAWCVDALEECGDCNDLTTDSTTVDGGSRTVCDTCCGNYSYCDSCEEYVERTSYVEDIDQTCCDDCQSNLSYCEACDERVGDYHECPNSSCDCSPTNGTRFTFHGIDSDTRHAVSLPDGVLSDEGRYAIRSYLYGLGHAEAARLVEDLEPVWQSKRGSYTKRLGSAVHKAGLTPLDPAVVSEVGNLFRAHSGGSDVTIDMTRLYDRGAEYFAHSDSCWFTGGDYGSSLCWLKQTHGFGLRTVGLTEWDARGRAWVLPVKHNDGRTFEPTSAGFTSCPMDEATAYLVFNGYGDLEGYQAARIVAQMTGLSYTKISLGVSGAYINGGSGYLVGTPALVATRPDVTVSEYSSCR